MNSTITSRSPASLEEQPKVRDRDANALTGAEVHSTGALLCQARPPRRHRDPPTPLEGRPEDRARLCRDIRIIEVELEFVWIESLVHMNGVVGRRNKLTPPPGRRAKSDCMRAAGGTAAGCRSAASSRRIAARVDLVLAVEEPPGQRVVAACSARPTACPFRCPRRCRCAGSPRPPHRPTGRGRSLLPRPAPAAELGRFEDHAGYDGVSCHCRAQARIWSSPVVANTRCRSSTPRRCSCSTSETGKRSEPRTQVRHVADRAGQPRRAEHALTFADPDGFRVVLAAEEWNADDELTDRLADTGLRRYRELLRRLGGCRIVRTELR